MPTQESGVTPPAEDINSLEAQDRSLAIFGESLDIEEALVTARESADSEEVSL
jgi:hypothetical protein